MGRRELIAVAGMALFAWPAMARAQQAAKVSRIGYLRFSTAVGDSDRIEALRAGLRALGHVEGRNLVIEFRRAETVEQLQEAAAELVRLNVDKETVPHATRFGVLWTPTAPSGDPTRRAAEAAGEKLRIPVKSVSVRAVADFAGAFAAMARDRVDAVFVHGSALTE